MDLVEAAKADSPQGAPNTDPHTDPHRSARLDTWLTAGVWVAGIALAVFAGFFAYNVYAQTQADLLANPALQVINAVVKQVNASPKDPTLHSRLAEALGAAGRFDEAKQELATAIKLDPTYVGAFENLATIELMQKDYTNSAVHWQKVIDLTAAAGMQDVNQRREAAFFHLGEIALIQKDYVGAVGYFNAAIRIRKDASDTYLRLAQAYAGLGQESSALEQVDVALQFDPKFPEAHFQRGKIYLAMGDKVNAAWDFRAALDGAPDNPEATSALASLGSFESWYGQAVTASKSGETSAALGAVQIARSLQPDSFDAAMLHGRLLEQTGDIAGAVDAYTVASKIKPGDRTAAASLKRAKSASDKKAAQ
jgi:tetratricopeptide (TPR) repeat protein